MAVLRERNKYEQKKQTNKQDERGTGTRHNSFFARFTEKKKKKKKKKVQETLTPVIRGGKYCVCTSMDAT